MVNQEPYLEELRFSEISHPEIPSDSEEAHIVGIYEPKNIQIEWDKLVDLGPNSISLPIAFDSTADIEFAVYRGDAFTLPDEVWVDIEDPEIHASFDAGTSVEIRVKAVFTIELEWEDDNELPEISEMFLDEIEDVSIIEDKYGKIF